MAEQPPAFLIHQEPTSLLCTDRQQNFANIVVTVNGLGVYEKNFAEMHLQSN